MGRWVAAAALGVTLVTAMSAAVAYAVEYGGGSVQSYSAEQRLDHGAVVELSEREARVVKKATKDNLKSMFGVVVDPQQVPLRLSNEGLSNETYVAVSGTYNVLVSTEGGAIVPGDHVTLSSVSGVAMKAGTEEASVFGRAAAGFDGKGATRGSVTLRDVGGNPTDTVQLGSVPVTIEIIPNPNEKSTKADVPEFLERIGQAIAEKEVSAIRIYISLAITAVSLITALVVLYVGVRNSVISIGRNPMSKKSIFRALIEIILTSVLILVIGLFAVYLLLRL